MFYRRRLWARRLWARRRRGAERRVLRAPPEAEGANQDVGLKYEKLEEGGVFEAVATVLFAGTGIHPGGQAPALLAGAAALFTRLRLLRVPLPLLAYEFISILASQKVS